MMRRKNFPGHQAMSITPTTRDPRPYSKNSQTGSMLLLDTSESRIPPNKTIVEGGGEEEKAEGNNQGGNLIDVEDVERDRNLFD